MSNGDSSLKTAASAASDAMDAAEEVYWIRPTLPTILGDLEELPIPGTDLIFASIEGGLVFPGTVDVEQLKRALARSLQIYPHAAGRLRCSTEGVWTVALTNSPVSLKVACAPRNLDSTDPSLFEERSPVFVDQIPYSYAPQSGDEEPLSRLQVTYWPLRQETSIFLSWCHLLGDGSTAFGFLHTLSSTYLCQEPQHIPTFEKYLGPRPPRLERHLIHPSLRLVPHLCIDYDAPEFFRMYTEMLSNTERVDLQFSADQLRVMKHAANRAGKGSISTQDSLAAYLITVLNRVFPKTPCARIMNVVDFRGAPVSSYNANYTPPSVTAAGNLTITHFSDDLPSTTHANPSRSPFSKDDTTLGEIASFIRAGVATVHNDGEYVRRVVSLSEELYPRSAAAGRLQWWFPYPVDDASADQKKGMTVAVNNLYKVPFPSLSYSVPSPSAPDNHSRFYAFDSWDHYLRIWPGNPTRDPKTGRWKKNEGSARTFFRVEKGMGTKVKEVVKKDFEGWLDEKQLKAKL